MNMYIFAFVIYNIYSCIYLQVICNLVQPFITEITKYILAYSQVMCNLVQLFIIESYDEVINQLVSLQPRFLQYITDELLVLCLPTVKLVNDIPRLYRKTNREVRFIFVIFFISHLAVTKFK